MANFFDLQVNHSLHDNALIRITRLTQDIELKELILHDLRNHTNISPKQRFEEINRIENLRFTDIRGIVYRYLNRIRAQLAVEPNPEEIVENPEDHEIAGVHEMQANQEMEVQHVIQEYPELENVANMEFDNQNVNIPQQPEVEMADYSSDDVEEDEVNK